MQVTVGEVELCVETFGTAGEPAIVLIGGAASAMDFWETEFCERLAGGGRFVVRFDLRDTGRSTNYPAGAPAYTGEDLAYDVVGLLDALKIERAHLVGVSMGGGIAQRIGIERPERVASLTLIDTSPATPRGEGDAPLPPPAERLQALFSAEPQSPDWTDRDAVVERFVSDVTNFAGSAGIDEARARELAGQVFDRTTDMAASQTNHWIIEGGSPIRGGLGDIKAPTLVLHGTEDPLFPLPHGEALAREIAGARLVPLPGVGHEFPPRQVWPIVVPAILAHTAGPGVP